MIIVEWSKPGMTIDDLKIEDSRRIGNQVRMLEGCIQEANAALNMFEKSMERSRPEFDDKLAEFEMRLKISRETEEELYADGIFPTDTKSSDYYQEYDRRRAHVEDVVRHKMWASGYLPSSLISIEPFIIAKAFIHTLDIFGKFLRDIAQDSAAPKGISEIEKTFYKALPDLKEVRNSIQHAEDRSKGMARQKKIDLKKVDTGKMAIEGKVFVSAGLMDNKFGVTMADGHYGAIEISAETVHVMLNALLGVYSEFKWSGWKQRFPN